MAEIWLNFVNMRASVSLLSYTGLATNFTKYKNNDGQLNAISDGCNIACIFWLSLRDDNNTIMHGMHKSKRKIMMKGTVT